MKTNKSINNDCIYHLTLENKDAVINTFLKYANIRNYQGEYDFSLENGMQIEWGKYGYSAMESEQDEDLTMLYSASQSFNKESQGTYVAFPEWSDKYNTVQIMDLKQISNNEYYLDVLQHSESEDAQRAYKIIMNTCK